MKRAILLVFLIGLAGCSSVEPVETVPDDHWTRQPAGVPFARIGRGVTNIVISPLDLPMTMWRVAEEFDEFGYGAGVGQGLFNMTLRLIWGAGETCTFFFITDPEPVYDVGLGERAIFRDDYRPAEMP
jgi:putative exosortase-associated protein (TIGR04073 family)